MKTIVAQKLSRCASANPPNAHQWSVNIWGSHPDEGNDDCSTGADFDTEEEARACFADPTPFFGPVFHNLFTNGRPFLELDGPAGSDVLEVRQHQGNQ